MSRLLPLIETNMDFKPDLCEDIESATGEKCLKVGGRFQHADLKNANGRVYPFPILQREVSRVQEDIMKRKMVGECDHPADGQTSLKRISHVITKLEMTNDKEVYGEYETLSNDAGKNLRALLKDKVGIGVSSRGSGHVINKGGTLEVAEDYQLITFDAVSDPSTPGAYPILLSEQVIELMEVDASTNSDSLLSNFYEVMRVKGLPGLKFDMANVDTFINAYKDFIKQDLTVSQYTDLRNSLLAEPQSSKDNEISKRILSQWGIALGNVDTGMIPGKTRSSNG